IKVNNNNSSMSALQLSLTRPSRNGFQWQTQYMWSHNISDNAGAGDGQNLMISNCRTCDRGDADLDIRHTVTAAGVYDLPYGKGRRYTPHNRALGGVLGGWSLSGVGTARAGIPFNVSVSRSAGDLPDGVVTTPGKAAPPQRPDFVPGVAFYPANPGALAWLNAGAFKAPVKGVWGNLPRNALRGPGLWQMDLSVFKTSALTERFQLEFRAELFNLFNRAQFGNPNANFSNLGTFGTITSVVNTSPTGAGGPRQVQLALRLKF
ncbi:MAG: TonB-dependent receptor, partial [Acidobacteria bacterium]|nr:TonB-dependent receptor [Acidobacteriota bacterium]